MKRVIVLLLVFLSVLACFAGCAEEKKPTKETTEVTTSSAESETEPEETVDNNYVPDLPEEKFSGTFNILCEGAFWGTETDLYYEEASDDPVLDAVWRRCEKLKDQFDVEIMVTPSADTTTALKNSVKSGDGAYDAIVARMPLIASSAANGDLMDLKEAEGIDLTKHYWDQSANSQLSIANKQFYTVGDIITVEDSCTWTMMFNKGLAERLDLEDPYQVVKDGRWTFDYFYNTMKDCGIAKPNDQGEWDYMATYAFATHRDMAYGFFYAAGLSFIQKDGDDLPYLDSKDNEKIQNVLNYSLKVMRDTQLTIDAHKWVHVNPWATILTQDAFEEDRALFYAEVLSTIINLRSMDTDFGLLPMPKYDEKQEEYITFVNPAASLVGIPIYQKNKENARRSGYILEAMAYYGHEYVMPEYIEKAIKGKSTRDEKSIDMLEILFKHRMYDLGLINDWNAYASGYSDLVFNNKNEFSKLYKKVEKSIGKKINKFVENIIK
jgi:ABC-type glycerol-3-phosphate transport system substrate-binding protein